MTKLGVYLCVLLAGSAVVISQATQAQNLIVNSNFVTGDFTGWNVAETGSGGDPADYGVTAGNDGGYRVPNSGDTYGAYFNPSGGTLDLSQTVDIPAAGTYIVNCSVQPVINDQDTLTIYLGGAAVFSTNFEYGEPYTQISATVSAQAGPQVIDFQFTPGGGPMFFDDAGLVAAVAAPRPVFGLGQRLRRSGHRIKWDEDSKQPRDDKWRRVCFRGRFAGQHGAEHDQRERLRIQ